MNRRLRRFASLAAAGGLLFVAWQAARHAAADVFGTPTQQEFYTATEEPGAIADDLWLVYHDTLRDALALSPNPEWHSDLGWLWLSRTWPDDVTPADQDRFATFAGDYYRAALAVRPTWANDWTDLAEAGFQRYADADPAYHQAIINAVEFGASQPNVQAGVARNGLESWAALSPAAQQAVLRAIDAGLDHNLPIALAAFDVPEYFDQVCAGAAAGSPGLERIRNRCAGPRPEP